MSNRTIFEVRQPLLGRTTLGACTLALGALTAHAANAGTVEFWSPFTGPDGATIERMVADYNEGAGQEAGITVDLLIVPWEQYYTKLTVALASGRAPDLAIAHSHRIAGFVRQGALESFSEEDLGTAGVDGSDYVPVLWQAGEIDGEHYAVPIDAFPRNIYYNKKLFRDAGLDPDAPPATGDQVRQDAEAISALGDDIYGTFFRLRGAWVARDFYTVYWQYTDDLLSPDQTTVAPGFKDAARQAITQIKGLIDAGLAPDVDIEEYESPFVQNRIGIAFSQITDLPLFRDTEGLEYGVAPIPQLGEKPATFALGHNFVIPRGTGDAARDDDLKFIDWFSDHSLEWAEDGKVPASRSVLESEAFKALKDQSIIASQLPYMRLPPTIAVQPDIDRVVQETLEAVYAGRLEIDPAVEQMANGITDVLAKQ